MVKKLVARAPVTFPVLWRCRRQPPGGCRAPDGKRRRGRWLLLLALVPAMTLFAQQKSDSNNADPKWEVLSGCRLVTNSITDGDSFRVMYQGREYIFRLYFVDTPEGDAALRDRIKDQAAYFGIRSQDIPRAAKHAAQFTRDKLAPGEFTVITRWRNAMGRSTLARFYGVVLVDGKNLADLLVVHGHARIYGLRANWPDGERSTTFINHLKNLELTAREQKRGVWDQTQFPRVTDTPAMTNSPPPADPPAPALVDLNTASYEELQKLPGIGPKLAERIMAHRPYGNIEDVAKVPGIGPVLTGRLQPLVQTGSIPP